VKHSKGQIRTWIAAGVIVAAVRRVTRRALEMEQPTRLHNSSRRVNPMRLQDYDIATQFVATVAETHRITPVESSEEVRDIALIIKDLNFEIEAGQNVGVLTPGHDEFGQDYHLRLYTIADLPEQAADGSVRVHLCVKRCTYIDEFSGEEFRGLASNYLCDLKPGDSVTLTGPYGLAFELPRIPDATLILIGAGTGIAPFRAMVKQLYKSNPQFAGRVWLFYGARTGLELLYMNDVQNDFAQYYDRETFEAIAALSKRPHWSGAIDWNSVFLSRGEELWSILSDPKTFVYLAGLEHIRDELDAEFSKIAGSEERWAERKAELEADKRWSELLY
jgi:ferredoxin--NADP+ reductase